MTRSELLAEELYALALASKAPQVHRKRGRMAFIRTLSAMQYLVYGIGTKRITDEQAREILCVCRPHSDGFDTRFMSADGCTEYADEAYTLLLWMQSILTACTAALTEKSKGYAETAWRSMGALHNIARAFLPHDHPARLSAGEAAEYAKPYLDSN